jgi:two-component system nitrogen regulation response regulator GlnG
MKPVWIIDDDRSIRWVFEKTLAREDIDFKLFSSAQDALTALNSSTPQVVVSDIRMPGGSGLELLQKIKERHPHLPVIIMTAYSDLESAVAAFQGGAFEYLPKPFDVDHAVDLIRRAMEESLRQSDVAEAPEGSPEILGQAASMQEVFRAIGRLTNSHATVLINGESGTGKELVARAVHTRSKRAAGPFVRVNCGALTETLLESELFGHEKGAFTGAAERRLGRFELAQTGTIFLDEVGEMAPSTQVKLLRVLENRTFFRVGGVQPIKVDVRVLAATNRSLRELVALGEFRDDLYYRLNVLNIYLPPLRERRSDIPLLVRRFIREFAQAHDRTFRGIAPEAMQLLVEAPWPGNVRQLRNLIESMVVLAPGAEIRAGDIPADVLEGPGRLLPMRVAGPAGAMPTQELEFILRNLMDLRLQVEELRRRMDERPQRVQVIEIPPAHPETELIPEQEPVAAAAVLYRSGMTMADVEKAAIQAALEESRGNRRQAAEVLGIGERTLYRKIKAYKLD